MKPAKKALHFLSVLFFLCPAFAMADTAHYILPKHALEDEIKLYDELRESDQAYCDALAGAAEKLIKSGYVGGGKKLTYEILRLNSRHEAGKELPDRSKDPAASGAGSSAGDGEQWVKSTAALDQEFTRRLALAEEFANIGRYYAVKYLVDGVQRVRPDHPQAKAIWEANKDSYEQLRTAVETNVKKAGPVTANSRQYYGIFHAFSVPTEWDKGATLPLLVIIHGSGSNGSQTTVAVTQGLGQNKIAILGPTIDLYSKTEMDRYCQFLVVLIHHMRFRFGVNPSEVVVAGHSGGAIPAYQMANKYSRFIAGAASFAGNYYPEKYAGTKIIDNGENDLPVLIIKHGKDGPKMWQQAQQAEKNFKAAHFVNTRFETAANAKHAQVGASFRIFNPWFNEIFGKDYLTAAKTKKKPE